MTTSPDSRCESGPPCWGELLEGYIRTMLERGTKPKTISRFCTISKRFQDAFQPGMHVTPSGLRNWEEALMKSFSPTTVKFMINTMRNLFNWAYRSHLIEYNPFRDFRRKQLCDNTPQTYITHDEYEQLRIAAKARPHSPDMLFALECAWDTGLRLSDVCLMRWSYVDWNTQSISFIQYKLRRFGEQSRQTIPLIDGSDFTRKIRELHSFRTTTEDSFISPWLAIRYQKGMIASDMQDLFEAAGIGKSFHDFRRAKYTSLAATKFTMQACCRVMGTRDQSIFMRYTKDDPDQFRVIRTEALNNQERKHATQKESTCPTGS